MMARKAGGGYFGAASASPMRGVSVVVLCALVLLLGAQPALAGTCIADNAGSVLTWQSRTLRRVVFVSCLRCL